MPRIRTIKPDLFFDEDLAQLSHRARLFFIGLFTQADREGRGEDRPAKLRANILPYEDVDGNKIMAELSPRFIVRYRVLDKPYFWIRKFTKHQRPHHTEMPSEIPSPPEEDISLVEPFTVSSPLCNGDAPLDKGKEGKGKEGKGRESVHTGFKPPELEEIKAYCLERKNRVDPERWLNHYQANGWRIGKNSMKDWRAAVRTWEQSEENQKSVKPQRGKYDGIVER